VPGRLALRWVLVRVPGLRAAGTSGLLTDLVGQVVDFIRRYWSPILVLGLLVTVVVVGIVLSAVD
jgi:hypothetical protein